MYYKMTLNYSYSYKVCPLVVCMLVKIITQQELCEINIVYSWLKNCPDKKSRVLFQSGSGVTLILR